MFISVACRPDLDDKISLQRPKFGLYTVGSMYRRIQYRVCDALCVCGCDCDSKNERKKKESIIPPTTQHTQNMTILHAFFYLMCIDILHIILVVESCRFCATAIVLLTQIATLLESW